MEMDGKIIRSSSKALTVTSDNFKDLRQQITDIYELRKTLKNRLRSTKFKHFFLSLVHFLSFPLIFGFFYKEFASKKSKEGDQIKDLNNQIEEAFVKVSFADKSQMEKSWLNCIDDFSELMKSEKVWDLTYSQAVNRVKERSSADTSFKRTSIKYSEKSLDFISCDLNHLYIPNANGPDLYIFPTFLILYKDRSELGIFDLKEIDASFVYSNFIEEEKVPSDTEVISQVWKKSNRDGSRDKRFNGNYQIPVVRYGKLDFYSKDVLEEAYMFSNFEAFGKFGGSFNQHSKLLTK